MVTIVSKNGRFRAYVTERPDGVQVALFERSRNDGADIHMRLGVETIDAPFHVVLDLVADNIDTLRRTEVLAWPTRDRVVSINGVAKAK